jgi:hypothetical protein
MSAYLIQWELDFLPLRCAAPVTAPEPGKISYYTATTLSRLAVIGRTGNRQAVRRPAACYG